MARTFKLLLIFSLFLSACATPTIRFQGLTPALVDVPTHITSIGIINRSERPKSAGTNLEKIITAELPGESKMASEMSIDGLADFLRNSQRFTVVRSGINMAKDTRANAFPSPLTWSEVESLCKELNVDAIISLEVFNSDYIIPTSMAIVNVGYRLYDLSHQLILDQEIFRHEIFWKRQVGSGLEAIGRILDKDKAIKEASFQAGNMYGQRIAPSWYPIARDYYNRPKRNKDLRIGSRMMEVNDWNSAIDYLSKGVEAGNRKSAGRSAHNLAVVYEITGDLESAKNWSQKAWGVYRNKGSKNYPYVLGQRIQEQRILDVQLEK
jgi:hypothetical protein